jgi:predicted nucleic acid-binding Zn ribbon protein
MGLTGRSRGALAAVLAALLISCVGEVQVKTVTSHHVPAVRPAAVACSEQCARAYSDMKLRASCIRDCPGVVHHSRPCRKSYSPGDATCIDEVRIRTENDYTPAATMLVLTSVVGLLILLVVVL